MPRVYKPTRNRQYRKHDEALIAVALHEYNTTNTTLSKLEKKYNIPKTVLYRHNTFKTKKQGGQTALQLEEEEYITTYINICLEWGYPLETTDFRYIIKGYLEHVGCTIKKFKDNLPGPDFVKNFLKRHEDKISQKITQNNKKIHTKLSPEVIEEYYEELEASLEGVPLENIINYDEINLTDEPDRKKVVIRRSAKYPERLMNHTKGATSVILSTSADGTMLPPYVVYKARSVNDRWRLNGPKGCRYNCTSSGWVDATCFEDWVQSIIIPYFSDKSGIKILIGDHLVTPLSLELIRECHEYNIRFIFLPANSIQLTHPLHTAIFKPLKIKWQNLLNTWKRYDGGNNSSMPKKYFPILFKKLMSVVQSNFTENILSAFERCGINPLNKDNMLEQLSYHLYGFHENEDCKDFIKKEISMLTDMEYGIETHTNTPKKRKKVNSTLQRSVENMEIETLNSSEDESKEGLKEKVLSLLKDMGYDVNLCDITPNKKRKLEIIPATSTENVTTEDSDDNNSEGVYLLYICPLNKNKKSN